MDRIESIEGTSVVQMQKALVTKTIQPETEQTSRVRFQESLALQQQQSLAMVQIMLHVSVSSLFIVILVLLTGPNFNSLPLVRDVVLPPVCLPVSYIRGMALV